MASRLTLLYGTSGVGKSSVLQAGVVARAARRGARERGPASGPGTWRPRFAVAGDPPRRSRRDPPGAGRGASGLDAPRRPATLSETLEAWAELDGDLLVILDQFEEYFLYHRDEDGEGTFAVELPRAVNRLELPVHFLISIREDAIARLDRFKGRIPTPLRQPPPARPPRPRGRARGDPGAARRSTPRRTSGDRTSSSRSSWSAVLAVTAGRSSSTQTGAGAARWTPTATTRIEAPYLQLVMRRLWQRRAGGRAPASCASRRSTGSRRQGDRPDSAGRQ